MKKFIAGTIFGILLTVGLAAAALHRMGKLDKAVALVREKIETVVTQVPDFPYQPPALIANDPNFAQLGACAPIKKRMFPDDNPWNKDISLDSVDPLSDLILDRIGDHGLHPEFGAIYQGVPNGIPYVVVGGDQKKVPIVYEKDGYGDQSDPGPFPIPDNAPIEGGPNGMGDRHVSVLDRDNWKLYELFYARPLKDGGGWSARSGAVFDLKSNKLRPTGWTSADAAGLPILPGLVRYDETMLRKEIPHALRFTVEKTRKAFVPPATHFAADAGAMDLPPMGMRLRLKADYDISNFPEEAQVILRCLKKYGMILADNGGPMFLSGAPDPRWNDTNTHTLRKVKPRDFEVVKMNDVTTDAPPVAVSDPLPPKKTPDPDPLADFRPEVKNPDPSPLPSLPPAPVQTEPATEDDGPGKVGVGAPIKKRLFPADNPWNQDISKLPVDRMSDAIIRRIGADKGLHPEYGTVYRGAPNGIPYVVVPGNQKKVPVYYEADGYGNQSDPGPMPIPFDAPIEGGPSGTGDRHVCVLDRDNWKLYELFAARPRPDGSWSARSGAVFDLSTNKLRPLGWTSADAAGLPILPGLVRYDEAMIKKEIPHALRFTVEATRPAFVLPATHYTLNGPRAPDAPPMGMRVRLKADYDISGFPEEAQVVLKCLKKYGMILADNGGPWFIQGAPDPRWNDLNTHTLKKVKGRDLEVVEMKNMYGEK